jgi:hypothetical protein
LTALLVNLQAAEYDWQTHGHSRFFRALLTSPAVGFFKRLQLAFALGLVLGLRLGKATALRLRLLLKGLALMFGVAQVNNESPNRKADNAADNQQNDAWSFHEV